MNFKELLKLYEELKYELKRNRNRQFELREIGGFPKTGNNDGMPKARSASSPLENFILALLELEEEERGLQQKIIDCGKEIYQFTCNIKDIKCRIVVEEKLVYNKTWKQIAIDNFYSISNARKLYYEGLKEVLQ